MHKPIPISALQHYLFCPRQCALIHNEQVWADNQYTAEGQVMHEKVNEGPDEHRTTGSILRHLHISSDVYQLTGICDVVERHRDGMMTPVEYKRGKPKNHRADEVQLCAQALCLEEMFQIRISSGLLFYGKTRRRQEILLDDGLRDLTRSIIAVTAEMFACGVTPPAEYVAARCDDCSLIELCLPRALRLKRGVAHWFHQQVTRESVPDEEEMGWL
jgi:CRISPR-associated exonuclease Cas4